MNSIRALSKLFFRLDTRSADGSLRKLVLLFITYLVPGIFVPFLLTARNTDPSGFSYALLTFLFFSIIIAFTVVSEFDNIVITQTEIDLLTVMPVNTVHIVTAKMIVLFRYIFIVSLPLLVPGSIFFVKISGSSGYVILYYLSGFSLLLLTVFVLLLIYAIILKAWSVNSVSTFTLIFQVSCIIILIIGYQYISYMFAMSPRSNPGFDVNIFDPDVLKYVPHAWFAFIVTKGSYVINYKYLLKIIVPFVLTAGSYYSLKLYLLDNYVMLREKFMMSRYFNRGRNSREKPVVPELLNEFYLRGRNEKASFSLLNSLYKRDKAMRLNIVPMLIIPVGLALFAVLTGQLPDPFIQYYLDAKPVFHISILLAVLVVLNTSFLGMRITNFSDAAWIYDAYPVSPGRIFINGARKFLVYRLIVPVCLLLFIVFLIKMPFMSSLLHILFIFSAVNLYNTIAHAFTNVMPLSKENTLVNSVSRITGMIYPFAYGIIIIYLQTYIYDSYLKVLAGAAVLFIINLVLLMIFIKNRKD